ncbi:zinc finger protein GLIS2-like [Ctenocephalides felis]|uniref:zinc finger protein GLIS2-like n=1 Tax=Ctenocephalides felis TaxID=7515 RepID=UPI000E6E434C|nr:zinc finger protein GLIS2-like [Ctenocephalides felis]
MLLQYHSRMGTPLYYSPRTNNLPNWNQGFLTYGNATDFTEDMQLAISPRSYNNSSFTESDEEGAMCIVTSEDTNGEEDIISVDDDGSENFVCKWDDCQRQFDTPDNLAQHVTTQHATASRGGQYFCHWKDCPRSDRGFNARYKMLVHIRTHTKEKPHRCTICEKRFSRAENLKIHLRSHSGERPYVCPVMGCNKAYSNSSDRFKHTKTHSTDRPYFCKIPGCNKRYTDPSSLRKHVKTFKHHTSQPPETPPEPKPRQEPPNKQTNERLQIPKDNNLLPPPSMDGKKSCNCSHECFEHLQKASEIFKIGALLNQEYFEKGGNSKEVDAMEVADVPLDLSIHK